ncbi:MAG: D-tyrosyl-tRNA(Tyr) deacylase [Planctomycetes bacterium]|nr:D-tyrosyl-tRNA(Tyr) deacylase [Planctomycetota bacterium]
MRVVVQRVRRAAVVIADRECARIAGGLLVLLGVAAGDTPEDAGWLAGKVARLRIFPDDAGLMNRAVGAAGAPGDLLVVSQFTLLASTCHGNRPAFTGAARPEQAEPLYREFVALLAAASGRPVATGTFGADMQVELVNDGPVTIIIDSRLRE